MCNLQMKNVLQSWRTCEVIYSMAGISSGHCVEEILMVGMAGMIPAFSVDIRVKLSIGRHLSYQL